MHAAYAGSIHGCTWPSRNSVLPSNLNEVCSTRLRHSFVQSLYYTYIRWFFVTCTLSYGLNPLLIALHYITLQTTRTAIKQHKAFSIVGPSVWNSLPSEIRSLPRDLSSSFYKLLKTF